MSQTKAEKERQEFMEAASEMYEELAGRGNIQRQVLTR